MENKIIITKDAILKVSRIEKGMLIGFDIFTEKIIQVPNVDCMEITSQIISILGNEEHRVKLANLLGKSQSDRAKVLNLSERQMARLDKKYINHDSERTCAHIVTNNNFSEKQVKELRKEYHSSKLGYGKIAYKWNTSVTTVRRIINMQGKYKNI